MIQPGISQSGIYLIDSCEISEEALGVTEQRLTVRTNHQVTDVPLGAKRIKQQLLPVGQTKRRQHHKVVLIAHQKGGDGQRLRGLVCTCWSQVEGEGNTENDSEENGINRWDFSSPLCSDSTPLANRIPGQQKGVPSLVWHLLTLIIIIQEVFLNITLLKSVLWEFFFCT